MGKFWAITSFSLIATTAWCGLGENSKGSDSERGYCEEGDACCTPEPRNCIDCVCYTPQYYNLKCDWGLFLNVDFLYWYAKESNLSYAVVTSEQPFLDGSIGQEVSTSQKSFTTRWDPGVRAGIGFNSDCDGWDYHLYWTYFKNNQSNSISVPLISSGVLLGEQKLQSLNLGAAGLSESYEDNDSWICAKWKLTFNSLDLELGRRYWLSPCFLLRPFVALRGDWIDTDLHITQQGNEFIVSYFTETEEKSNSCFWGAGFATGLQPSFYFTPCFSLFGGVDVALLWGEYKSSSTFSSKTMQEDGELTSSYAATEKGRNFQMQGIFDTAIGLRYASNFCCDRYQFSFDAGWEHHLLVNFGSRGGYDLVSIANDLGFGGFVLRARFDF